MDIALECDAPGSKQLCKTTCRHYIVLQHSSSILHCPHRFQDLFCHVCMQQCCEPLCAFDCAKPYPQSLIKCRPKPPECIVLQCIIYLASGMLHVTCMRSMPVLTAGGTSSTAAPGALLPIMLALTGHLHSTCQHTCARLSALTAQRERTYMICKELQSAPIGQRCDSDWWVLSSTWWPGFLI